MNDLYTIVEILDQLIVEHERMLKLAGHKKDVLIKGAINDLARILQFESRCITTIQSLEVEREKQISLYLMQRGVRKETCYISDLIEMTGNPELKKALTACQQKLGAVITELKHANELNQKLIEQSLAFVNMSLEELTAPPEDEHVYKKTTARANPYTQASRGFFDSKA
ncbi:flagellar protein FlgN [Aneurinibacillus sp. BA2021]|nr:flagellar protein FlgN [Aneurinibacillus sp. BA2021]